MIPAVCNCCRRTYDAMEGTTVIVLGPTPEGTAVITYCLDCAADTVEAIRAILALRRANSN